MTHVLSRYWVGYIVIICRGSVVIEVRTDTDETGFIVTFVLYFI